MKLAMLNIGDELLSGHTLNTNSAYLAAELNKLGINAMSMSVVADTQDAISAELKRLSENDVILVSGGLGPTVDDRTIESASAFFETPLVQHHETLKAIEDRFRKLGRKVSDNNLKQALIPEGAEVLPNTIGTAPGVLFSQKNAHFIFLPGVPEEMKSMFQNHVVPKLKQWSQGKRYFSVTLKLFGLPESHVDQRLQGLGQDQDNWKLGIFIRFPEVHVTLTTWGEPSLAQAGLKQLQTEAMKQLEGYVFGQDDESLASVLGHILRKKKFGLAVAESCSADRSYQWGKA